MDAVEKISYFNNKLKNINVFNIIKSLTCYFYIISFLIGLMEIYIYFSSENMLAPVDFNTLMFSFFIGMLFIFKTFTILIPITATIFFIFKFIFPEKSPFLLLSVVALSCLVGSAFFDKSITPKSIINKFSRGNYSATLLLREEGCKVLKDCSFLKVTPQGTIEDVNVFFSNSKSIYLKINNKIIELPKELILTEVNKT